MRMTTVLLALVVSAGAAQSPAFELASVKPTGPISRNGESRYGPGAIVRFLNVPLRAIIADAYGLDLTVGVGEYRLVGGSADLLKTRFDIDARSPEGATLAEKKAMLRTLLADRFKLQIRKETRQIPLYALTVAGNEFGPGFKKTTLDCDSSTAREERRNNPTVATPCNVLRSEFVDRSIPFRGAGPIPTLVRRMQENLDRPLVDQTELTGNFEWATKFRAVPEGGAPLFVDAVRQDLGLRILPTTGPFDVWVIDSVEMPSPN